MVHELTCPTREAFLGFSNFPHAWDVWLSLLGFHRIHRVVRGKCNNNFVEQVKPRLAGHFNRCYWGVIEFIECGKHNQCVNQWRLNSWNHSPSKKRGFNYPKGQTGATSFHPGQFMQIWPPIASGLWQQSGTSFFFCFQSRSPRGLFLERRLVCLEFPANRLS